MSEVQCTMRKIQALHSREWFFCLFGSLWMGMSMRTASFPSFLDAKVFLEFFAIQNQLLYLVIYKYPSFSASSTPGEPTIAVIADAVCATGALIQWAETALHGAPQALTGLEPFCQKWRENRNQNFTCLRTACLCVLWLHHTWTQTQQQKKNLHLHIACCVAFCFKTFWLYVAKTLTLQFFFGHYEHEFQTFHGGSTHWALPIHTIFSDLGRISRLQQCQTVSTENFMFLSY